MLIVPAPALPSTTSFITEAVFWNSPSPPKLAPKIVVISGSSAGSSADGLLKVSTVSAVFT